MKYIVVDDETFALEDLEEAILEASPGSTLAAFTNPDMVLEYAKENVIDVAFLDIVLGSMDGLSLAKKLKDIQPKIHIIFVTGYKQYALGAIQMHATGYIMKPAAVEDLKRELTFLYGDVAIKGKRIKVQTFGFFEISIDGVVLHFARSRTKELLALLVDRKGASVTTREACEILWEGEAYDKALRNHFHQLLLDLRGTLSRYNAKELLISRYNEYAITPDMIDCDSYRFMEGDPWAINRYQHDYLPAYSWAEFMCYQFEK